MSKIEQLREETNLLRVAVHERFGTGYPGRFDNKGWELYGSYKGMCFALEIMERKNKE